MEDYRERNHKIYEERLSGASFAEIGRKYNICLDRARTIFLRESRKVARESDVIHQLLSALFDDEEFATRAYNVLFRSGIDCEEKLIKMDGEKLRKLRGCGAKMENLILQVIEVIRKDGMYDKVPEV